LEVLGLLSYSIAKLELGKSAFSGRSSLLNIASIISMHKVLIVNLSFFGTGNDHYQLENLNAHNEGFGS